jgi:heparan-alpha-glucosaminide N-acetyltransferase
MQGREASLDVFKGLTIALLIIVYIFGGFNLWPKIDHSPWDGITIADLIIFFPFLLLEWMWLLGSKMWPTRLMQP